MICSVMNSSFVIVYSLHVLEGLHAQGPPTAVTNPFRAVDPSLYPEPLAHVPVDVRRSRLSKSCSSRTVTERPSQVSRSRVLTFAQAGIKAWSLFCRVAGICTWICYNLYNVHVPRICLAHHRNRVYRKSQPPQFDWFA